MRTLARLTGLFLWNMVLVLGWLCFGLVVLLTTLERTGLLASMVQGRLERQAGALPVRVTHARVAWFETRLELVGLELGPGGELARLEQVELDWRLQRDRGLEVSAVRVRGGRVWIAPEIEDWIAGLAREGGTDEAFELPPVEARGISLEYDLRGARMPLGTLELRARSSAPREIECEGLLSPRASSQARIHLGGRYSPGRELALDVQAAAVPFSRAWLPQGALLEALQPYAPRAILALQGELAVDLAPGGRSRGRLRLSLTDGNLLVAGGAQRIEGLALDLDGRIEAESPRQALDPSAWECTLALRGAWNDAPFEGWGFLGRQSARGARARGFVHLPALPLDDRLVELLGGDEAARTRLWERWQTFAPRGQVELWAGFELPGPLAGAADPLAGLCVAAEVGLKGETGLTYLGWPLEGGREAGFPLPLRGVQGACVFARDPARRRPNLLALVDLQAESDSGPIRAQGLVHSHAVDAPPFLPGCGSSELELHFQAPTLDHDPELEAALRGLGEAVPAESTWMPFRPQGGTLGVDFRLVRKVDMSFAACDLDLELREVDLAWSELPLPLEDARGRLRFRSDGKGERGLAARFTAGLETARALELALRFQTDPALPHEQASKRLDQLSCVEARVGGLSLTGSDKKTLVQSYPEVGSAMDLLAPRGVADAYFERVQAGPGALVRWRAEITPLEVALQPQGFRVNTSGVRGRVIVVAEEPVAAGGPARVETALAPLLGVWPGNVQVAFEGRFPGDRVNVWAAGIALEDSNLRGALGQALSAPGEPSEGLDMSALAVEGALDMVGLIRLDAAALQGGGLHSELFLRGNTLSTTHDFRLRDLRGVLQLEGRRLEGRDLSARLGSIAVRLGQVALATGPQGFQLDTDLAADELPLDREHLAGFVDRGTLDALIDGLKLSGTLDIQRGHVRIRGRSQSDSQLEFSGEVALANMSIQLGLPWRVASASAFIDQLLLEGGQVRARAHIQDLFGEIAGRDVSHANLLVTYVEPRLSIEDIQADLEGGKLRPLGAGAQRSGTAFSIGLQDPYEFQLALDLSQVDVGGMLRGLFPSDFATRGKLDAKLRLTGNTERILDIQGSGSLMVTDSRLWSIPVFRALFSQLGLDNAAVFQRMYTNVHVQDGRVELSDIKVESPILQLVGRKGSLDFNGDMSFDLQLRYALIDRLGPLTRMIYWIQKELLSVSIRGDMARPSVLLKNPISGLFGTGKHERALPLPAFSPLPPRF